MPSDGDVVRALEKTANNRRARFRSVPGKLALLGLLGAGRILAWAEVPPTFEFRLDTPLTSYDSPDGTAFTGTAISDLEIDGQIVIPQGSLVYGTVLHTTAVGFGLVHERASMELAFEEYELADGIRYPLGATLEFIENAREEVDSQGRIRGVLAANSPQGLMRGIWYRPTAGFFHKSLLGLTGVGGELWSRFSLGPFGAAGILAAHYIAFRLPEPEIQLVPGTEMRLLATGISKDAPATDVPADPGVEGPLADWLRGLSADVTKPDGTPAADKINLAFIGNAGELQAAFSAAGWVPAEPLNLHSFSTAYRAYNSMSGYPTAPMSTLLYRQTEPAAVFQKSLNTITKRHHIRIWQAGVFANSEVWFGAATHDAGVSFESASLRFTHRIDPRTDRERRKVITDLSFAGCSEKVSSVDRPDEVRSSSSDRISTDGGLAVIWLRSCHGPPPPADPSFSPPGSRVKRFARRFILETRQYFLRDNMYYWAYRAVRWGHRNVFRDSTEGAE